MTKAPHPRHPFLQHPLFGAAGESADFYPSAVRGRYSGWQDVAHSFAPRRQDGPKPLTTKQIHSAIIHEVHQPADMAAAETKEADGIICSIAAQPVAVITADCVPVLIAGQRHVAALHCGWRGIERGLLENALDRLSELGENPEQLRLATGPFIQLPAFEVGPEVVEAFAAGEHSALTLALGKGQKDRWHLDMGLLIATIAAAKGLLPAHIAISRECTKTARDPAGAPLWPSYRREGKGCGRLVSTISL